MVGTPILLSYMNYLSFLFSVSSKFGFCSLPPTSRAIILPWLLCPLSHQNCMACFAVKFSNSSSSSFSRALCITWYHWPLPPLEALSWLSDQLISWLLPLYGVLSCHSKANTFFLPYIYIYIPHLLLLIITLYWWFPNLYFWQQLSLGTIWQNEILSSSLARHPLSLQTFCMLPV